jgi:hypothetical protein
LGECFDEGKRSRGKIWDQDVGGRSKSSERTNEGEQKQETRKGETQQDWMDGIGGGSCSGVGRGVGGRGSDGLLLNGWGPGRKCRATTGWKQGRREGATGVGGAKPRNGSWAAGDVDKGQQGGNVSSPEQSPECTTAPLHCVGTVGCGLWAVGCC